MKLSIQSLIEKRKTSILTPVLGVGLQILSWLILFPVGVAVHKDPVGTAIFSGFAFIWFFIPLASIFGFYAGLKYMSKNGKDFLAIAGVCLNTTWLILFLLICYMVFYIGITV